MKDSGEKKAVAEASSQTQNALLPCPFCAGKPRLFQVDSRDEPRNEGGWCVECTQCQASSRVHFSEKDDGGRHVIEAWNNRAHPVELSNAAGADQVNKANIISFLTAIINTGRDFFLPNGYRLQASAANLLEALQIRVPVVKQEQEES